MAKISANGKKIGRPRDPNVWIEKICKKCDIKFQARKCYTKRGQMNYCSSKCGYANSAERNGRWLGGRRFDNGYLKIYSPNHPLKDSTGYVMQHRLLMEKKIGRFLKRKEVVHHKNNIKTDNRIENLELFKGQSEHRKLHIEQNKSKNLCNHSLQNDRRLR